MFAIRLGIPEMEDLWAYLLQRKGNETLTVSENLLYKKMGKAMRLLANNPRHLGLNSHEIEALSSAVVKWSIEYG